MRVRDDLPISPLLPEIVASLAAHPRLVLEAPPGAGKTTQVPLALLDAPWLAGKIILLEPRRLAARSAAGFMAKQLGEDVGATVGYRIRFESRVSARTRIEVVTEAILTRMLQDDPTLEGVGAVLFDEFHERHLHSDLGLALALEVQHELRADMRIVAMSATLEGEPAAIRPAREAIRELGRIAGYVEDIVEALENDLDGRKLAGVKRRLERLAGNPPLPADARAVDAQRIEHLLEAEGYFRALADGLRA